jgi:hypothetical protein
VRVAIHREPAARRGPRPWAVAATVAGLLGLGAAVAWQVRNALGISFTPADVPPEDLVAAAPRGLSAAPPVTLIVAPDDLRVRLAASAVADALVSRGIPRPSISASASGASTGTALRVALTGGAGGGSAEAYRLRDTADGLLLETARPAGAAAGLYALADRIRSGEQVLPAGQDGRLVAPRLGLRLVDTGAVGLDDNPAGFVASDDYSLNTDVVGPAVLAESPYVDGAGVARIATQFRQLVEHCLAEGYNGVVVQGFLEYVTFSGVGDGHQVYPEGDSHIARAQAMVAAFGPVWKYAHDAGMKVYFATDMLALCPPLQRYLRKRFGGFATDDPALWRVYQAGLRELFTAMPYADGLMIRVGEGGSAYRFPGWDYTSQIAVKSPASVKAMLRALLAVAGEGDRDIIFRTWTIGVGSIGDLHTNPQRYEQVLGDIDDPHLIVSTKYCLGDYYSYLPLNTTLSVGRQRRIVEFQARREFEAFGCLPNDLGALQQEALRKLLAANPHIEGVWTWTQMGGPLRAGPRSLYLRAGFWQMFDLNVYTAARLAADPDADAGELTADWIRQTFSTDPSTVEAIGQVMALSRDAITKGLYIGPYARRTVKALGVEPPPMMWIFEWDIVTGDSAVLASIYDVSRDQLDEAIGEGEEATATAKQMRDLLAATDPARWRDPALYKSFMDTLDYQVDLFDTLGAYRSMFLRYAEWLDTGSPVARARWLAARSHYRLARDRHVERYTGNVDLPAYRFPAADIGLARAERDMAMAWLARSVLAVLATALVLGALARGRRLPGAAALHALWVGSTRPWRVGELGATPTTVDSLLVWALPAAALALSRGAYAWFASPTHLLTTLGGWTAFAAVLRGLVGDRDASLIAGSAHPAGGNPFALWAALGGAAIVRTAVLLVALAGRGPGRYWYGFWTRPQMRSAYITIAFAAFLWAPVAGYFALRSLGAGNAFGPALAAAGTPVALLGGVMWAAGLEDSLAVWNDEMALLPWGMHRILGITGFLDLPLWIPKAITALGGALVAAGGLAAAGRVARLRRRTV